MELKEALEVVLDLAAGNTLEHSSICTLENAGDIAENTHQNQAIDEVWKFARTLENNKYMPMEQAIRLLIRHTLLSFSTQAITPKAFSYLAVIYSFLENDMSIPTEKEQKEALGEALEFLVSQSKGPELALSIVHGFVVNQFPADDPETSAEEPIEVLGVPNTQNVKVKYSHGWRIETETKKNGDLEGSR